MEIEIVSGGTNSAGWEYLATLAAAVIASISALISTWMLIKVVPTMKIEKPLKKKRNSAFDCGRAFDLNSSQPSQCH